MLKTPISYYGGKQLLCKDIVKLLPSHQVYCEPFVGGGAVFFAKDPAPIEIINDTNANLINFYHVLKNNFPSLQEKIQETLHSRELHRQARIIYENPDMFDQLKRAWALWVLASSSFGSSLKNTWTTNSNYYPDKRNRNVAATMNNKKIGFTEELAQRIEHVQIECCDALKIIKRCDSPNIVFYLDPPYPDTYQGHYDGYSADDFRALLEVISEIQGKFLLSSFRHPVLKEFTEAHHWTQLELSMLSSITALSGHPRKKIEVLTANYPIDEAVLVQQRFHEAV